MCQEQDILKKVQIFHASIVTKHDVVVKIMT